MNRKALAAAVLATATLTAGCGSTAKSAVTSGNETFYGSTPSTSSAPTIRLHAIGVVTTTGSITLSGSAPKGYGVLHLADGNLRVYHVSGAMVYGKPDLSACTAGGTESGTWTAASGSTGTWKGATGSGTFLVSFQGKFVPPKGQKCTTAWLMKQSTSPASAETTFTASGHVKLAK
jgi:hypothetical protein